MTQIEVILLGLLCERDYYGYEFETIIEKRKMRKWTNIGFSSIYNSLNKLEKKGYLVARYEKEYGSPKRKVYSINDEAKVIIKEQLIRMIEEYKVDPSEFNIGLLFSYLITRDDLKQALIKHKGNLIREKETLFNIYNNHPRVQEEPHTKALFERPLSFIDTELIWIKEFIRNNFFD